MTVIARENEKYERAVVTNPTAVYRDSNDTAQRNNGTLLEAQRMLFIAKVRKTVRVGAVTDLRCYD